MYVIDYKWLNIFLIISAYFPDHFAVQKVPPNLQIETSCGHFETS